MIEIVLVIREAGRLKPDYSLKFQLPGVPAEGSYISIQRPDKREPYSEDLIVRKVWWRFRHPKTRPVVNDGEETAGGLAEIIVECDPAIGPYASDQWRDSLRSAKERGEVQEFEVSRFSVRESELSGDDGNR